MSGGGGQRPRIKVEQLCIGLHVRLDSWLGHPFLLSSFRIKDQQQIEAIRSMGLVDIEYVPAKSESRPLPIPESTPAVVAAELPAADGALDALMQEKKSRIETLSKERERIRVAEKKYLKTANAVKNAARVAGNNPAQAAELSHEISVELVDIFLADQNPYIHLMGDHVADESLYFHSVNVTVLSLILARAAGLDDYELLRDIAQGAILHDVGKAMVPSQILLKDEELSAAEATLLRMHPGYGIRMMQAVESLPQTVREIICFHHEMVDGSGYPKGLAGDALKQAVRVVAITNAYDNLCNQRVVARSKTPAEALASMFKHAGTRYDKTLMSVYVKSMGIYPPGTIVVLKSGRVGIVMSVDASDLLHPDLMLYDASIPKQDAAVVNLRRDLDDSVERTLRPAALPPAVHDYLSPRKRVCYFVDNAGAV